MSGGAGLTAILAASDLPGYIAGFGTLITSLVLAGGFLLTLQGQKNARDAVVAETKRSTAASEKAARDAATAKLAADAAARDAADAKTHAADVKALVVDNNLMTAGIADEVASTNGIKVVELLERAEGRRIEDIPFADRTASEQQYVDKLVAGGRDMGHENQPGPQGPPREEADETQ